MNTPSNAVSESAADSRAIAPAAAIRPMYWSVRRELWENRSIFIAPLVVFAVVLFGFAISTSGLPHRRRAVLMLNPTQQRAAIEVPYDLAAFVVIVTAFIVGIFYCLDALHSERRDRSILFWKSLPVSDVTTVLSKASIPLVVLPLLSFVIILSTHVLMLLMTNAVLLAAGFKPETLAPQLNFLPSPAVLLYALTAMALWHAPIYAWMLLVSGWARRAPFLWAVLPVFAINIFERMAFGTSYFGSFLRHRVVGWFPLAFEVYSPGPLPIGSLTEITPGRFLSTPGLWIGLGVAAMFLTAAVELRRYREPI